MQGPSQCHGKNAQRKGLPDTVIEYEMIQCNFPPSQPCHQNVTCHLEGGPLLEMTPKNIAPATVWGIEHRSRAPGYATLALLAPNSQSSHGFGYPEYIGYLGRKAYAASMFKDNGYSLIWK